MGERASTVYVCTECATRRCRRMFFAKCQLIERLRQGAQTQHTSVQIEKVRLSIRNSTENISVYRNRLPFPVLLFQQSNMKCCTEPH